MAAAGAQYVLPAALPPAAARRALGERLELRAAGARPVARTFLDSFDGRLHAAGLVAVHADGRLALASAGDLGELASVAWRDAPARVLARELPRGRLRELLLPLVEARALLATAHVEGRSERLELVNDDGKAVARLAIEQPRLRRDGSTRKLRPRLVVRPVRGYRSGPRRVAAALAELGLTPAGQPLHGEAVAAAGGRPGGTRLELDVGISPAERADRAAARALERLLEAIEANLEGAIADLDDEFLHDLRVAVRRSRSVQRQLAGAFPPEPLARFRARFRRLGRLTGPARDLAVGLLELDERAAGHGSPAAELEPLRRVLERRRRREQERLAAALRSPWAGELLAGWRGLLERLPELPERDRPDAARPIGELAGERIRAAHAGVLRMGRRIDDAAPAEALHELRKRAKELRYLLELFGGAAAGDGGELPSVRELKRLGGALGRHQDRDVQAALVLSLAEAVRAEPDGARALLAMGVLLERLERERAAARSEFAAAFASFAGRGERARGRRRPP